MGGSKKKKGVIKQGGTPSAGVRFGADPDHFYHLHPAWAFSQCDNAPESPWPFGKERLHNIFWDAIFPKLQEFERMTWAQILMDNQKQNHGIDVTQLNKCARDRLAALHIEAEALYSLRLGGKLRIYGYLQEAKFFILWYDENHGDNDSCVCRSKLKHT